MKKLPLVAVILSLGWTLDTVAQVEADGSILVANWDPNEIVFAADSRQASPHSYQDVRCKIAAFDDKVIFGATGRRTNPVTPNSSWDIYAAAPKQFARINHEGTKKRIAEILASAWGNEVKNKFQGYGETALAGLENNKIAGALFADFEPDGSLLIAHETINYERSAHGVIITAKTEIIPPTPGSHTIGKGEIVDEITGGKTRLQKIWQERVNASFDRIAEEAIAAVDLTIENLPKTKVDSRSIPFSEVGPPTAAVRLRRDLGIDWPRIGTCKTEQKPKSKTKPKKIPATGQHSH
jgi:hypothetical protein